MVVWAAKATGMGSIDDLCTTSLALQFVGCHAGWGGRWWWFLWGEISLENQRSGWEEWGKWKWCPTPSSSFSWLFFLKLGSIMFNDHWVGICGELVATIFTAAVGFVVFFSLYMVRSLRWWNGLWFSIVDLLLIGNFKSPMKWKPLFWQTGISWDGPPSSHI